MIKTMFNKKSIQLFLFIGVFLLLLLSFFAYENLSIPKKVHFHAGFVVFNNNKKVDFSDIKYMKVEPCVLNHKNEKDDESAAAIQQEKAHLHDFVSDIVHVEKEEARWSDLFTNIHYPINFSQTVGYINGKKVVSYQNELIMPYDSLVVFIGENDASHVKEAVTKQYMQQKGKASKGCGD